MWIFHLHPFNLERTVVKMMIIDNLKAELATYKPAEVESESEV